MNVNSNIWACHWLSKWYSGLSLAQHPVYRERRKDALPTAIPASWLPSTSPFPILTLTHLAATFIVVRRTGVGVPQIHFFALSTHIHTHSSFFFFKLCQYLSQFLFPPCFFEFLLCIPLVGLRQRPRGPSCPNRTLQHRPLSLQTRAYTNNNKRI